jgi:hypothetical protein
MSLGTASGKDRSAGLTRDLGGEIAGRAMPNRIERGALP